MNGTIRRKGAGWIGVAAALALLGSALSCSGPGRDAPPKAAGAPADARGGKASTKGPPSLLLVTLDTWRWDYCGASGSGRVATPALDALAKEGAYEPEAETPYPETTPAHASLLTGLLPLHHRVLDCVSYGLPANVPTLTEAFAAKGYATAAFVSSLSLDRRFGLQRGFQTYDEGAMGASANGSGWTASRDGAETTQAVLSYLRARGAAGPTFLWVHYFDLHLPYRSRPAYDSRYPADPYAAQAAFVDDQVAALLSGIRERGGDWRVIVVGDHGEGLGDHHEAGHGMALYRSTLHVPLILHPRPEPPLQHSRPWRLEDLDATVREWFDLPAQKESDGESLFQKGRPDRFLPSLTLEPSIQYSVNPCLGIRRGGLMYMRHGLEELFDLESDPAEARNLAGDPARTRDLKALREACDQAFPKAALQAAAQPTLSPSGADLGALQGLGYIGGYVPAFTDLQQADIRKVCDDEARFAKAKEAYRRGHDLAPLLEAYRDLLARYPRAALFYKEYGGLLLQAGDQEGAFRALSRAVKLNPKDEMSLTNLGGLYLARGKAPEAKVLYEAALALEADDPVAHKNLGIIYQQFLKDPSKAAAHYRKYLEHGPDADAAGIQAYVAGVEKTIPR